MAQWARLQMNGEVRGIYGPHFPLELRHYFASWIESKTWADIDFENPANAELARSLVTELLTILQQRIAHLASGLGDTFLLRLHLEDLASNFLSPFLQDPLSFVRVVSHCLSREAELLGRLEADQVQDKVAAIETNLTQLQWHIQVGMCTPLEPCTLFCPLTRIFLVSIPPLSSPFRSLMRRWLRRSSSRRPS